MTLPGLCFGLRTMPVVFSGSRKPRPAWKIVCAYASVEPKAVWNGYRNILRLSPSSLCMHPLKTEHQTDQGLCPYPRAPAELLLVTPKASTKALRIFILTRPKQLARVGQASEQIHWLCISRIHMMACWACAL